MSTQPRRKLIEVGLPLDEINAACKADKDRKTGTLRNIHKWFAPMPLPAWRALLFAALVDDPEDEEKRLYLIDVIKRLVKNGADLPDPPDLREAQLILQAQFPEGVPTVMDPFCGGGSTLVEGQRLGLPTYGSDLNPVPVLITRTLTDLLPKVFDHPAVHCGDPVSKGSLFDAVASARKFRNYEGLISDVEYYANQIKELAWAKLSIDYPSHPSETPVAWLWARTATCPNPACGITTVLATTWWLSKKKSDLAWLEPEIVNGCVTLTVVSNQAKGHAPTEPKVGRGDFNCLACPTTLKSDYLRAEGMAGRLGSRMTAVVVEVAGRRIYREPTVDDVQAADRCARPEGVGDSAIAGWTRDIRPPLYGLATWADIYTNRQLRTLATYADLVASNHAIVVRDGGDNDWADAITTILGLSVASMAMAASSETRWRQREAANAKAEPAFGRNDIPMMWDFAEVAIFGKSVGSWLGVVETSLRALRGPLPGKTTGVAVRADARVSRTTNSLVATDPPYFDAIGYADLSDYFYLWHRLSLRAVHPDLYASMHTPKVGELTAIPSHHDDDPDEARRYFIRGFTETFTNLQGSMGQNLPCIIVYASKEQRDVAGEQSRWASILTAMIDSGLEITGSWPIHGTGGTRMISMGTNAVATYIAMVARPRDAAAVSISWGEFAKTLRRELPGAIHDLQISAVLPVDIPQAVMGPGMRIFSRYPQVTRMDGSKVTVDDAIAEINRVREEVLDSVEGDLDRESQCAVAFWSRFGWAEATFDDANAIVRPRGLSVSDLERAEVLSSPQGRAHLLGAPKSLDRLWDPQSDSHLTAWEGLHHLADRLIDGGGDDEAASLYSKLQQAGVADSTRALAYRMAVLSAQTGRGADEQRYNDVIEAWPRFITRMSSGAAEGLF